MQPIPLSGIWADTLVIREGERWSGISGMIDEIRGDMQSGIRGGEGSGGRNGEGVGMKGGEGKADTKRCRVGETSVGYQPSGTLSGTAGSRTSSGGTGSGTMGSNSPLLCSPAPEPSPTRAAEAFLPHCIKHGVSPRLLLPVPVRGRLRTNLIPPFPIPIPSQPPNSHSHSLNQHSKFTLSNPTQTNPAQTATYMSTLIKEVTPVRNLDVRNPYQAAGPVGAAVGAQRSGSSGSRLKEGSLRERVGAREGSGV
ncbi:hypothetical protein F5051DRAFT_488600, partial [Lentinula edodes]